MSKVKYEFIPLELTDKAFDAYLFSDFVFYYDTKSKTFWYADNPKSDPVTELGNIHKVNQFLESWADIED